MHIFLSVALWLQIVASQLGLGNLPNEIRSAVQFVPNKIYAALAAAVSKVVLSGNPSGPLYDGVLTKVLTVKDGQYRVWTARAEYQMGRSYFPEPFFGRFNGKYNRK